MKVLIIKQSSLGDVIHCLPAVSDATDSIADISFDWVVESGFAEIVAWHPSVDKVIEVSWRRWRKSLFSSQTKKEMSAFKDQLQEQQYDLVIDAQGLYKSVVIACMSKGRRAGLSWSSIRKEKIATLFYDQKILVPQGQHAIDRQRQLFAKALNYPHSVGKAINYGIKPELPKLRRSDYVVGLHGTTWKSKQLPKQHWLALAATLDKQGIALLLPHGNQSEKAFAESIADACKNVEVLPPSNLAEIAAILKHAIAACAVDTGLAHLAAALNVPLVNIFGSTNPDLTAALGQQVEVLQAQYHCVPCMNHSCKYSKVSPPCYESIANEVMHDTLDALLKK